MNLKTMIAVLVLGSSSVAMAAPAVSVSARASIGYQEPIVRDHRAPAAPPPVARSIVRDHRDDRRDDRDDDRDGRWNTVRPIRYVPIEPVVYQPTYRRWSTIASGVNFGRDGRAFIHMYDKGAFRTIRLAAPAGGMLVREVAIEFTDRSTQVLRDLDRVVDQAHPLTIDLDGNLRTVNTVVVYGPKGGTNPGFNGCAEVTLSAK